jgi:hypothetical protein
MEKEKYINSTTEDFILDEQFVCWVLEPDEESDLFWKSFLTNYPEKVSQMNDAILIIQSLRPLDPEISDHTLDSVFQKIVVHNKPTTRPYIQWMKYAAGIALIITAGALAWFSTQTNDSFPVEASIGSRVKGKVILSSGVTREFETEKTIITQTSSGNLTINNDTITLNRENEKKKETALNQIIIPYGKRSEITLADGTHIWLNSGSQLSYPSNFKANSREVYLSGEAFFDVAHDASKPFYVVTRDFRIKVLGTKFNVSCYSEDKTIQTVLLEGMVSASKNKRFAKSIELLPGERMVYDKTKDSFSKDKVDVQLFASWMNGYLIFENEPIFEVVKKLERYYNQKIVSGKISETITFSGKLDLKENIKDVLENISYASSVKVTEENGVLIIN